MNPYGGLIGGDYKSLVVRRALSKLGVYANAPGCLKLIFSGTIIVILPSIVASLLFSARDSALGISVCTRFFSFSCIYREKMSLETEVQWEENGR